MLWFFSSKCRTQFPIAQFRHWTCIIEGLHDSHVGWQEQYNFSLLGNEIYFHLIFFLCSCHPTWLPWKPSIGIHYDGHLHVLHISTWPKQDAHSRTLIKVSIALEYGIVQLTLSESNWLYIYNGMLVPVRTSFGLRRRGGKTYNVSTYVRLMWICWTP